MDGASAAINQAQCAVHGRDRGAERVFPLQRVGAQGKTVMFGGLADAGLFKYETVRSMRTMARRLIFYYIEQRHDDS